MLTPSIFPMKRNKRRHLTNTEGRTMKKLVPYK